MEKIDRKTFFDGYRAHWGKLAQDQVNALELFLGFLEGDGYVTDVRHAAYMLATVKRETGNTFRPIEEWGKGKGKPYGKPDRTTGQIYYGRGYSQVTWVYNYRKMGAVFGLDLLRHPELALIPEHAYKILSYGMRTGAFTGRSLRNYIHGDMCDYRAARYINNGQDHAAEIALDAIEFEQILLRSLRRED